MRRLIAVALAVLALLSLLHTSPAEATPAPAAVVAAPAARVATPPSFPYSPAEVRTWWNDTHGPPDVTGSQAYYLAAYMNAVVRARLGQYLLAVYLSRVDAAVPNGTRWDRVAACESGGNWQTNTGNSYYGGLQFNLGTWRSYGGPGYPHQQSRETQIRIAERVRLGPQGLGAWPVCGRRW